MIGPLSENLPIDPLSVGIPAGLMMLRGKGKCLVEGELRHCLKTIVRFSQTVQFYAGNYSTVLNTG
jgi:hypothetical protein